MPPAVSAHAGQAAGTGYAALPGMLSRGAWQVVWPHVTYTCYGVQVTRWMGELLPATPIGAEADPLETLAQAGAIRRVEACATEAAFTAAVVAAAAAELARLMATVTAEGVSIPPAAEPVAFLDIGPTRITRT